MRTLAIMLAIITLAMFEASLVHKLQEQTAGFFYEITAALEHR